jgi:hypothetical protein
MKRQVILAALAVASWPAAQATAQQALDGPALAAACGQPDPEVSIDALSPTEQRAFIACLQREAVAAFKSNLPQKVDDVTTLTDITAEGLSVTYHLTVDVAADSVSLGALVLMRSATRGVVCKDAQMTTMIGLGSGYRYVWKDRNGVVIGETTVDSC